MLNEFTDEEVLEWVNTLKEMPSSLKYTKVPDEYKGAHYDKWFDFKTVRDEYNDDVLAACAAHPVFHVYYLIGFKLRDYQVYMMDVLMKKKYVQGIWGRRLGKSLEYKTFMHWAIHWNKFPQGLDDSTKVVVLAHTVDSAKSYISEFKQYCEMGDERIAMLFKGKLGDKYFTSRLPKKGNKKNKKDTDEILHFLSVGNKWCSIEVYPPTQRARGRPASIIIMDEMAFWSDYTPDEYDIYNKVVRPIPTDQPDVKLFIATTTNGEKGISYDLMDVDKHETRYELVWFPFYVRDELEYWRGIKLEEIDSLNQNDYDGFRQEYLADIVSAKGAYFDKVETERVFSDTADLQLLPAFTGPCRAGLDFGGSKKSHTVFTVAAQDHRIDENGHRQPYIRRLFHHRYEVGKDSTLQNDIINWSKRFPNITKWRIDSQGGGSALYGWFKNWAGAKLEEVTFRGNKTDMFKMFKVACFQNRVKSYNDPALFKEFNGFTGDLKPSKGYTDDMLDSFVMACGDWLEIKEKTMFRGIALKQGAQNAKQWRPTVRVN